MIANGRINSLILIWGSLKSKRDTWNRQTAEIDLSFEGTEMRELTTERLVPLNPLNLKSF